jgi:predicted GIY-YIG superfamily endonuclease
MVATATAVVAFIAQANGSAYLMRPGTSRSTIRQRSIHRIQPSFPLPPDSNVMFPPSVASTSIRPCTKSSRLTRFYVDEWANADVELAFNSKDSTPLFPQREVPLFQRLMLDFAKILFRMKELIRTRIERCTVYILELENGKYYVGSTTNRKRRIEEHNRRKGSKWTRVHKPVSVLREYKRIPSKYVLGMESRITAECMLEFGVNNVRGSMFCSTREFHKGDIAALTKFIGHYNDLNYRKVCLRLEKMLPAAPSRRRISILQNEGKCYRCGKKGHFVANCPQRQGFKQEPNVLV